MQNFKVRRPVDVRKSQVNEPIRLHKTPLFLVSFIHGLAMTGSYSRNMSP